MGKERDSSAGRGPRPPSTTPICRCRVMYLGSAVPHVTKDGLQGIQEPLRELYPENGLLTRDNSGIDSWLSVWSNGILVENVDDSGREVKRFFPIEALHYCAAVRYVVVPASAGQEKEERVAKFLPLDSPFSRHADAAHPPLFACILRRTTGIKVLECHAFVCKREPAANALVRCCFHAYADSMHAKQMDENPYAQIQGPANGHGQGSQVNGHGRRSRSISALDSVEKVEAWRHRSTEALVDPALDSDGTGPPPNGHTLNGHGFHSRTPSEAGASSKASHSPGEDNYKIWHGGAPVERQLLYPDGSATLRSVRSAVHSVASLSRGPPKARQLMLAPPGLPPPVPASYLVPTLKKDKGLKNSLRKLKKKHKQNAAMLAPLMGHPALGPPPPHVLAANGYVVMPVPPPHGMPVPPPHGMPMHPGMPPHGPHPGQHMYGPPPPASVFAEPRRLRRAPEGGPGPVPGHMPGPQLVGYGPNDEPVYIPPMRPLTPLSNYQGQPFHQEQPHYVQYPMPPQFATAGRPPKDKKRDKKGKKGDPEDSDSPFNTGIYKKKGHLNERAFSYSIRQEHRSRSNSLANIEFAGEQLPNGHGHPPEGPHEQHERLSNGHGIHNGNGRDIADQVNGKLAQSFESLQMNGHGPHGPQYEMINGHGPGGGRIPNGNSMPKTASIKRGSQNGLSKMVPVAPPPVPMVPLMMIPNGHGLHNGNGKQPFPEAKTNGKTPKSKASPSSKQKSK